MNSIYAIYFDPENDPGRIKYLNKNYKPLYTRDYTGYEEWYQYSDDGNTVDVTSSNGTTQKIIYDNKGRIVVRYMVRNKGTEETIESSGIRYETRHVIEKVVFVYDSDGYIKSYETEETTKTFVRFER